MPQRRTPLSDYIPQPADPTLPQSQPALGPKRYAENVSIGIGQGVRNQLAGLLRMAQNPKETLGAIYGMATTPSQWPAMAKDAAVGMYQGAASGPIGAGQVIGEMLPLTPRTPKIDPMRQMDAYHGSPHDFDQFDSSKIGTGEGAQAYGHGLYFAESPEVAKSYARALSNIGPNGYATAHLNAQNQVARFGNDPEWAADALSASLGGLDEYARPAVEKTLELIKSGAYRKPLDNPGRLYHVDIPDNDVAGMLDWDKPLSGQPDTVRRALEQALVKNVNPDGLDMGGGGKILDNRNRQAAPDKPYPWILASGDAKFGLSQKDVDRMVGENVTDLSGEQIYTRLTASLGSQAAATDALKKLGVPGIKFLDGGSRGAAGNGRWKLTYPDGKSSVMDFKPNDDVLAKMGAKAEPHGSRNFVVFDDKSVKMLKKE